MAYEDYHYITAGLAVGKNSTDDPAVDGGTYHNVFYITAGLVPVVLVEAPATSTTRGILRRGNMPGMLARA